MPTCTPPSPIKHICASLRSVSSRYVAHCGIARDIGRGPTDVDTSTFSSCLTRIAVVASIWNANGRGTPRPVLHHAKQVQQRNQLSENSTVCQCDIATWKTPNILKLVTKGRSKHKIREHGSFHSFPSYLK